jgi:hypothetical protein
MFFEGVVSEFQAFLWAVGPQVAVHAAVDRLAVFIQTGAPGVVPHAAPVFLLFIADQFRDVRALVPRRLEGPQLRHATGTGADDCYT